jgi:hypothetical protein
MVPSMVSQRKTTTYSLAVVAFLQFLLIMPGTCPSCYVDRAWYGARSAMVTELDGDTAAWGRPAGLEMADGRSGDRACVCCLRPLSLPFGLFTHEQVTALNARDGQSFLSVSSAPKNGRASYAQHAFFDAGLLSATQRCARCCRFLL